jgi:hypothetical protein
VNRTAYVVAFFRIENDIPVFVYADIYSEDAQHLTLQASAIAMDVLSASGADYEEARDNAKDACRTYERYRWLLPHLKD